MPNVQSSLLSPSRTGRGATNGSSLVVPAKPEVSLEPGLRLCSYCTYVVRKGASIVKTKAASNCISCELVESASPSNDLQDATDGIQGRDMQLDTYLHGEVEIVDPESGRMHASLVSMSVTCYL
jgi:hypothetical protein